MCKKYLRKAITYIKKFTYRGQKTKQNGAYVNTKLLLIPKLSPVTFFNCDCKHPSKKSKLIISL